MKVKVAALSLLALLSTVAAGFAGAATASGRAPLKVMLTFDDGAKDHYLTIAPLLEKYGMRGSFNIVTRWIGTPGRMSWADARDLVRRGHAVENHTASHKNLVNLLKEGNTNEVVRQIAEANASFASNSLAPAKLLCPPYVKYNAATIELARRENLATMTVRRHNFGHGFRGGTCCGGRWLKVGEFLDEQYDAGVAAVDVMCHGAQPKTGYEPFASVEDFERHLKEIKERVDSGKIVVILARDLR